MDKRKIAHKLNEIGSLVSNVKPQPAFVSTPEGAEEAETNTLKKLVHDLILEICEEKSNVTD